MLLPQHAYATCVHIPVRGLEVRAEVDFCGPTAIWPNPSQHREARMLVDSVPVTAACVPY